MEARTSKFRLKFLFQEFDLTEGGFLIGRSPSCNLTLEDPLVSRRHIRISVCDDCAILDDLGSRNGTLVNGEPVFEDYRLGHSDVIQIGSQELTFVEMKRRSPRRLQNTKPPLSCPHCDTPFDPNASQCAVCGTLFIPDDLCMHCRSPVSSDDLYCSRCGAPIGHDDATIPVELAGSSGGWTEKRILEVIESALSAQRYEQAARLLDGQMKIFARSCLAGELKQEVLEALSVLNIRVAENLHDERRLRWIVKYYSQYNVAMPVQLLRELETSASGWYDIYPDLERYLAIIQDERGNGPEGAQLPGHLRRMLKKRYD